MKKIFLLTFITIFYNLFADENSFTKKQEILDDIRKIIFIEESIAKNYEHYILTNYKRPSKVGDLSNINLNQNYTGIKNSGLLKHTTNSTLGNNRSIEYGIKFGDGVVDTNNEFKNFYESNNYRTNSYVSGDRVYFIFESDLSKHLFDIVSNRGEIKACPTTVGQLIAVTCIQNNHIYVDATNIIETVISTSDNLKSTSPSEYLFAYYIENFHRGPIIITENRTRHNDLLFNSFAIGTLMYDTSGIKYIKTPISLEILK